MGQFTRITASGIQDGSGSPLTGGTFSVGPNASAAVTAGVLATLNVNNPTLSDVNITVANKLYLSMPSVPMSGDTFNWDTYVQPNGSTSIGIGVPYWHGAPGAEFMNTAGATYTCGTDGAWVSASLVLTTSGSSGPATLSNNRLNIPQYSGGGGFNPGGTDGQIQFNDADTFGGFTVSGDATLDTATGEITVTATEGVGFATSATTDTTNADNITSGTLAAARIPTLNQDTTGTAGGLSADIAQSRVTNLVSDLAAKAGASATTAALATKADSSTVTTSLALKANLISPVLVTATASANPSAALGLATKQYVDLAQSQSLATANTVYITNSTYNGSGAGATTTTTSGVFSVGTTGTLTSPTSFAAGQGINIAGCGATISSTGTLASSTTLTAVTNASTIGAGALVSGTNIPAGCTVVSVNGTTVYISAAATGSGSGVALTFKNPYIGTIVSLDAGTGAIVVTPTTATAGVSGAVVKHDETAAIQAAVTAVGALGGGTIIFPDGIYLVNGPLTDTSNSNCVIKMPNVVYTSGTTVGITFQGLTKPIIGGASTLGAIIQTSIPQGNLIGGYYSASSFVGFTSVWLSLNYLTFRSYNNPGVTMINAKWIAYLQIDYVSVDIGATVAQPVNTAGVGIQFPTLSGGYTHRVTQAFAGGYYKGWIIGEHVQANHITAAYCHDAFTFDGGNNATYTTAGLANSTSVNYLWASFCTYAISAGTYPAIINIQNADLESIITAGINDPSNLLQGIVNYTVPFQAGNFTQYNPVVSGGTGLMVNNQRHPSIYMPTSTGSISPAIINDAWAINEGSGSTVNEANGQNTITLAGSSGSWGAVTGFPGSVYTFAGTSAGHGIAANQNTTNFTGATPFSVSAWIKFSSYAGNPTIISTMDTASNFKGWEVSINSAGAVNFFLVNTYSSNAIQVIQASSLLTTGNIYFIVCTNDGTKTAAGTKIYVNGAVTSQTNTFNSLSGVTNNSKNAYIGSRTDNSDPAPGVIANVGVYSRVLTAAEVLGMYTGAYTTAPISWVPGAYQSLTGIGAPVGQFGAYFTNTAAASSASPAVGGASAAGACVVAASATTVVVNCSAVTAKSQIFVQEDSSLGTLLGVTANTTPATAPPTISARTPGTSFTITTTAPTTNPRCFSYWIIN